MISEINKDINIQVGISDRFYTCGTLKGLTLQEIFDNHLFNFRQKVFSNTVNP